MGDKIAVINGGIVQQIGNPSQIYDHPASLFVAGFVGSPTMNFLDCIYTQENGKSHLTVGKNDFKLEISDALGKIIQEKSTSEELILGIRAEDIFVRSEASDETIQTEVYVVEPLGSENIIDLKIGDNLLRAKTLPTIQPDIGQPIYMLFEKDRMHVFDKNTEQAIS
jgi:multiple sugar transport system ATP-binding protein